MKRLAIVAILGVAAAGCGSQAAHTTTSALQPIKPNYPTHTTTQPVAIAPDPTMARAGRQAARAARHAATVQHQSQSATSAKPDDRRDNLMPRTAQARVVYRRAKAECLYNKRSGWQFNESDTAVRAETIPSMRDAAELGCYAAYPDATNVDR